MTDQPQHANDAVSARDTAGTAEVAAKLFADAYQPKSQLSSSEIATVKQQEPASGSHPANDTLVFNTADIYKSKQVDRAVPTKSQTDSAKNNVPGDMPASTNQSPLKPEAVTPSKDNPAEKPDTNQAIPNDAKNSADKSQPPTDSSAPQATEKQIDDVSNYLAKNANTSVDYSKMVDPNTRLVIAADLTHESGNFTTKARVDEFENMVQNLKNANPPLTSVGLESVPSSLNPDFKTWFDYANGNPNNTSAKDAAEAKKNALTAADEWSDPVKAPDAANPGTPPEKQSDLIRNLLTDLVEKDHVLPIGLADDSLPAAVPEAFTSLQNGDPASQTEFSNLLKQYGQNGLTDDQRKADAGKIQTFLSQHNFTDPGDSSKPYTDDPASFDANGKLTDQGLNQIMDALEPMRKSGFDFENAEANLAYRVANLGSKMAADLIDERLKADPNGRMLVSAGDGHVGQNMTWPGGYPIDSIDRNSTNKSTIFEFGGPMMQTGPGDDALNPAYLYSDATKQTNLDNSKFFVPYNKNLSIKDGQKPFDYFVYVPE
jgi:hypothetical protein